MFNIPFSTDNVAVFTNVSTGGRAQIWVKPQGCSMIYILAIGGGSGGGGGFSGASGTTRGGGGGGASGGVGTLLMPASLVPDALFIDVGAGGLGGAAGTAGTAGVSTIIKTGKSISTSANSWIMRSSNGNAGVGGAGTAAAGGGGGGAPAVGSNTISPMIRFGNYSFATGHVGSGGGAHTGAVGGGIVTKVNIVTGGCGGGGVGTDDVDKNGGSIILTNTVLHPSIIGGTAGGNGADGINNFGPPLFFLGGAGGASNGVGTGGKGGDGGIGCGGAGGGAGVTGGEGGRGGDGLVIIAWY